MSVKDLNYGTDCPICGDYLPGSDDAREVWAGLAEAAKQGITGNCGLCGDECDSLEQTKEIARRGIPNTGLPLAEGDPLLVLLGEIR